MKDKITTIKLTPQDTAIVLRGSGEMETYLRNTRSKEDNQPTNNEILTFVISNLMKDPQWIEDTVELYEKKKNTGMV